jgi:hypothetical protein
MQLECDQAFHRWCADEMVDLRTVEILEDAFTNGFWAGRALYIEKVETTPAPETAA